MKIHRVTDAEAVSEVVSKFWPGVRLVNAEGDTLCFCDDEAEALAVMEAQGDDLRWALSLLSADLDWAGV